MIYNDFPEGHRAAILTADTEAVTLFDGEVVPEAWLKAWTLHRNPATGKAPTRAEIYRRVSVKVYAWQISDGRYFCICDDFEEFCATICALAGKVVWWYNAKYDFANIDAHVLATKDWKRHTGGRLCGKSFDSLHGRQGQRYQYRISYPYRDRQRRQGHHQFKMLDFCNILGGGLGNLLKDLDVRDFDDVPIRKTTMEYQSTEITAERIEYMRNDVIGLFHAVRTFGEYLAESSGINILSIKPEVMTAGGIAKRDLINNTVAGKDYADRLANFKCSHWMNAGLDSILRVGCLYRGGVSMVNPKFRGKPLKVGDINPATGEVITQIWRGDVNSEHPASMSDGSDLYGRPERVPAREWYDCPESGYTYIIHFTELNGEMRAHKLPFFYDPERGEYVERFEGITNIFIFAMEFERLGDWYSLDGEADYCYRVPTRTIPAITRFIEGGYTLKAEGKRAGRKVVEKYAKIRLNSAYGKYGECPIKQKSHYEINAETGVVHLVDDGTEIDESALMSVIQASWITAKSRRLLMDYCDAVSNYRPGDYIFYVDTDSVHTCAPVWGGCDAYTLGGLKNETPEGVSACVYLAPKTYVDIVGGIPEFHTKGIRAKDIAEYFSGADVADILRQFKPGLEVPTLGGLNVPGGKALLYQWKNVCRPEGVGLDNSGEEVAAYFDA